ncbi:phosphatidylcholine-sterol O-acyltransferase-like protein [Sarocladium implicatum]|nr:phosphatidylcholine-sterol O-acyltransferase-like protein [Sarocladium implicatum]
MTPTTDAPPPSTGFHFHHHDHRQEFDLDAHNDVQAALQPSLSPAAAHLTLDSTADDEKIAALRKRPTGETTYFPSSAEHHLQSGDDETDPDDSPGDGSGESSPDEDVSPAPAQPPSEDTPSSKMNLGPLPDQKLTDTTSIAWPSPWTAGPKDLIIETSVNSTTKPTRPSAGILDSAFNGGDQPQQKSNRRTLRRSGSVGQEAFRRLSKAFPSSAHLNFNMLPSFHGGSFWPGSNRSSPPLDDTDDATSPEKPTRSPLTPPAWAFRGKHSPQTDTRSMYGGVQPDGEATKTTGGPDPREAADLTSLRRGSDGLRRVASDDDILYDKLTPQTSFDDGEFENVHEMVNMRFMAFKDSLPSLPKVNAPWRSSLNLSSFSLSLTGDSTPRAKSPSPEQSGAFSSQPGISCDSLDAGDFIGDELDAVLETLTGDIVVLGGYRGSVLRSAEPPYQQLWAPVAVGLNIRKVNLEVGLSDEDEVAASKAVRASGMLKNVGPVDISRKLIRKLKTCGNARSGELRVWDYGYDWRLSPHRLSAGLCEFLAGLPSNKPGVNAEARGALVIAHSLGGLITRHAVNQQPELFRGVLFAGVPQKTINILEPLRRGDAVLFNEKLLTPRVNFSIRTSFVFLPESGFAYVDKDTGEPYNIDFYNAEEWAKHNLNPCVGIAPPPVTGRPRSSSFSSFLPKAFRTRGNSVSGDKSKLTVKAIDGGLAPQMSTVHPHAVKEPAASGSEDDAERQRWMEYLTRTLARTKKFRAEMAHSPEKQEKNAYPPLAVLYGKSVPTVYAAQVRGRAGIAGPEVHDDLLFRAGDGVTLAKEAMLPPGYHVVRGGKVLTERGHITLLGDMPAVGRALAALVRGRAKGIGLGEERKRARGQSLHAKEKA